MASWQPYTELHTLLICGFVSTTKTLHSVSAIICLSHVAMCLQGAA